MLKGAGERRVGAAWSGGDSGGTFREMMTPKRSSTNQLTYRFALCSSPAHINVRGSRSYVQCLQVDKKHQEEVQGDGCFLC